MGLAEAGSSGVMDVAVIGCGFVADYYMATLPEHPGLRVVAAMDIVPAQVARFCAFWKVPTYHDLDSLMAGARFDMVLNLTNPDAHFEVSRYFLQAGKHVYSEKPFTLKLEDGQALVDLAERQGVRIGAAPCIHLSEAVQAMKRAIGEGAIGRPLLAYAEMDDDLVGRSTYRQWRSLSGVPWPYADEFEVGVTLEHVGYSLAPLMALFGPVRRVVSVAALLYPGKPISPGKAEGQDVSLAALEFDSGVMARLTCSNVGPRDHSLKVIGEDGVMKARDCWHYATPVTTRRYMSLRNRFMLTPWRRPVRQTPCGPRSKTRGAGAMDFARGPAEMVNALREGRPSLMPVDFALHVNEVSLAIHNTFNGAAPSDYLTRTRFNPLPPVTTPII
jgi:predicted dehydrogenase